MSKMGSYDPFGYSKHKLWPKERSGIKLTIWLLTVKSLESPWFTCVQMTCHILLEIYWWTLQLCFKPHLNWRFAQEVTTFQSVESVNFKNFGIRKLGSFRTKWHLDVASMANHREYYKGKCGGFLQVWAMVSLVIACGSSMH